MRVLLVPEDLRELTWVCLGFVIVTFLIAVSGLDVHLLDVDGFGTIWVIHSGGAFLRFLTKRHAVIHFDIEFRLCLPPVLFFACFSVSVILVELAVHFFAG